MGKHVFHLGICLLPTVFLFIVLGWLGGERSQAAALAVMTVNTLEDELNADEDCSLREAIEAANINTPVDACMAGNAVLTDTIGFEVSGTITLTDQLSVIAGGPLVIDAGGAITVSGDHNSRVLGAYDVDIILSGISIVNGDNGGLYLGDGSARVIQSSFIGNTGSGIESYATSLYIADSSFIGNSTVGDGGGVYNEGPLTIVNSTFSGNSAYTGGGLVAEDVLTLVDTSFYSNTAEFTGGGIWLSGSPANITGSNFTGNSSVWEGGGITLYSDIVTITGSTFNNNTAGAAGGINSVGLRLFIEDSIFSENSANYAGAIAQGPGTLNITGSEFLGNQSNSYAGGIENMGLLRIADSVFSGNSATYGGGIYSGDPYGQYTATLTLTNSTFSGNSVSQSGAAIYAISGTLIISNSIFTDHSVGNGATIFNAFGEMDFLSSTMTGNEMGILSEYGQARVINSTVSDNDGGIGNMTMSRMVISNSNILNNYGALYNTGILTVTNSAISDNTAPGEGGGIYNDGSLAVLSTTISGNVGWEGGGIYSEWDSPMVIRGSLITGNNASRGGGIYKLNPGLTTISNTIISNNHAEWGGGIFLDNGVLNMTDTVITGNSAYDCGGLVSWSRGVITILSSTVSGNIAEQDGGGICSGNILSITHSTLSGNTAGSEGGGIYGYGIFNILDSTFSDNQAGEWGGGMNTESSTVHISGTAFTGNSASKGGGIYAGYPYGTSPVTLTVTSSNFLENSAAENGAGIFAVTSTLQISGSTLSGNLAAADGGAIYLKDSTLNLTNNTLSANASDQTGGGIYNVGGTITVTNSTFSGNSAALQGGALFNDLGFINMENSILAHSPSGGNCSGEIGDGGHNIDSGETCGFNPANGSLPNTDPLLGSLQDNGGPTWTHALMQGSPAIDAGDPLICPPTDQRGVSRPYDGDGDGDSICDIGSFEFDNFLQVPIIGVSISGPASGELLNTFSFTATATPISLTLPVTYTWQASWQMPVTHTSGLSDVVSFQWDTTGIQVITLTASNGLAIVSSGHLITITDEPISGLQAHNDSPTELGDLTTLSATVARGTNVTYTWYFGDGTSGSGAVVAHIYAEEGVYAALVTATNSSNTITATTFVTVLAPTAEGERTYLPLVEN